METKVLVQALIDFFFKLNCLLAISELILNEFEDVIRVDFKINSNSPSN